MSKLIILVIVLFSRFLLSSGFTNSNGQGWTDKIPNPVRGAFTYKDTLPSIDNCITIPTSIFNATYCDDNDANSTCYFETVTDFAIPMYDGARSCVLLKNPLTPSKNRILYIDVLHAHYYYNAEYTYETDDVS